MFTLREQLNPDCGSDRVSICYAMSVISGFDSKIDSGDVVQQYLGHIHKVSADKIRERYLASEKIHSVGMELLNKVSAAIDELESEEISVNRLPSLLKSATDALVCSLEMQKFVLGIDRLIEEIQDIQKTAGRMNQN